MVSRRMTARARRHILDNVILLLVPSLNPDGQAIVADWYNKWVGTEHESGPTPWRDHPYVGHDNNRDMYMYTQAETRHIGQVLYKEWFPSIWLDEHQMGSSGASIFTMPATDPINVNVHPMVYRLNGFYGQAQAAALQAAGKTGIIYDDTYSNFWEGAMAWTGWWHNQVGMLTEVASARLATPLEQKMGKLGDTPSGPRLDRRAARRRRMERPERAYLASARRPAAHDIPSAVARRDVEGCAISSIASSLSHAHSWRRRQAPGAASTNRYTRSTARRSLSSSKGSPRATMAAGVCFRKLSPRNGTRGA